MLLGYIKADKLSDGTKARLCERFQDVGLARRNAAAASTASAPAASAAPSASCMEPVASSQSAGAAAAAGPNAGTQAGMDADVADSKPGCSYTAEDLREWRSLADCLSMFEYSEKGLRNVVERLRYYKHALGDEHVYRVFKVRGRKGPAKLPVILLGARMAWLGGVAMLSGKVASRLPPCSYGALVWTAHGTGLAAPIFSDPSAWASSSVPHLYYRLHVIACCCYAAPNNAHSPSLLPCPRAWPPAAASTTTS